MVDITLKPAQDGMKNVPSDCYLAVRVGNVQKFSKATSARSYHFPQPDGSARYGRIEVYRRIGCHNLEFKSNKEPRKIGIDCDNMGLLGLNVDVKDSEQAKNEVSAKELDQATEKRTNAKVEAAKHYLIKHNLEQRLSDAMQAVLRDRPEDPVAMIMQKLSSSGGLGQVDGLGSDEKVVLAQLVREAKHAPGPVQLDVAESTVVAQQVRVRLQEAVKPLAVVSSLTPFGKYYAANFAPGTLTANYAKFAKVSPSVAAPKSAVPLSAPPKLTVAVSAVQPFPDYYRPNFRAAEMQVFCNLYAKFPVKRSPGAPGPEPRTAVTKAAAVEVAPPLVSETAAPPKVAYGLKPSVGTWLTPMPRKKIVVEVKEVCVANDGPRLAYGLQPSVGTWLVKSPASKRCSAPVLPPTAATDGAPVLFAQKPSVGAWLQHRRVKPAGTEEVIDPAQAAVVQKTLDEFGLSRDPFELRQQLLSLGLSSPKNGK